LCLTILQASRINTIAPVMSFKTSIGIGNRPGTKDWCTSSEMPNSATRTIEIKNVFLWNLKLGSIK
jgi:hypothetical protein